MFLPIYIILSFILFTQILPSRSTRRQRGLRWVTRSSCERYTTASPDSRCSNWRTTQALKMRTCFTLWATCLLTAGTCDKSSRKNWNLINPKSRKIKLLTDLEYINHFFQALRVGRFEWRTFRPRCYWRGRRLVVEGQRGVAETHWEILFLGDQVQPHGNHQR